MKQTFSAKKSSSFVIIVSLVVALVIVISLIYVVVSANIGTTFNLLELSLIILPILIFIIYASFVFNLGELDVENGVLYRKRFFKTWSVNISSIADIIQGTTLPRGRYGTPSYREINYLGSYSSGGLSFRDNNGNFYQFQFDTIDNSNLINTLQSANPSIQFHTDPVPFLGTFGWKGNKRFWKQ